MWPSPAPASAVSIGRSAISVMARSSPTSFAYSLFQDEPGHADVVVRSTGENDRERVRGCVHGDTFDCHGSSGVAHQRGEDLARPTQGNARVDHLLVRPGRD